MKDDLVLKKLHLRLELLIAGGNLSQLPRQLIGARPEALQRNRLVQVVYRSEL